jgi:hypothetical protein
MCLACAGQEGGACMGAGQYALLLLLLRMVTAAQLEGEGTLWPAAAAAIWLGTCYSSSR